MIKAIHYLDKLNTSMRHKFSLLILLLIVGIPAMVQATHIIGGEINYTCLGNEQYEVELTVYRDCFFGADNAFFDNPASIAIFDANNVLLDELRLPFLNNDTLTPILSDSCLFVPDNVCVHTASYRGSVNLPFSAGGYTIVYQRCCRNETISNIVDPLNTGATFTATISDQSLTECNSGPKFKEFPPLFICVNEPINFDHSALDVEGDSLVYSLCAPYTGGDIINNQPQPAPPPPYETVVWLDPFDLDNVLGGTEVLAIDPATGLLTGTPTIQGQFVVGICIEEYKDGALISTSRRDFQYNVGECGIVAASIDNDLIQCENQNLTFINTSSNSNDFEWYFGDASNPGVNSTLENPTFMFPDTGVYTITLIAEPNGECADTLVQDILFKNSTLDVDFDLLVLECVDSVLLTVNNMSIDAFLGIEVYDWQLSDGQSSNLESPTFVLAKTQEYTLTLTATAVDGCSETKEFDFFANVISSGVLDTFNLCPGESVNLNENPFLGPNVTYTWTPTAGLDNPNAANPTATPAVTTIYTVRIDDPELDCAGSFSILVDVQEKDAIILFEDQELVCTEEYIVAAQTLGIVSYEWSQQPDFNTIISTDASFSFNASGNQTFHLRTLDERGCIFTDEVNIAAGALNVETNVFDQACLNEPLVATATNSDANDEVVITWEPAAAVLSGQGTLEATLDPLSIGENIYFAFITNQFGCERVDTFTVNVISDQAITEADVNIDRTSCLPAFVIFSSDHPNISNYEWVINDGGAQIFDGSSPVEFTFSAPGTYEVSLAPKDFVACSNFETLIFSIDVPASFFTYDFTSEVTSCGDIIDVQITDLTIPFSGSITSVQWDFANGLEANGQTINLSFDESGVYPFIVTLNTDLDCTGTYEGELDLTGANVLDVSFIDQNLLACNGDPVPLNPNGDILYSYAWAPPAGLSATDVVSPLASPSSTSTYTVTVTDPTSGCVVTRDVTVTVPEQQLDAAFSWDFVDCIGTADIQFIDESVYSEADIVEWLWVFSSDNPDSNVQNPLVSFDASDDLEVSLTVITADGCTETLTQSIEVDLVDLNLPDDNTLVCFGETLALNPGVDDERYSYEWSPSTGLSTTIGANPIASPAVTTTYAVTVTDATTGCIVEQAFTLVVPSEAVNADFEYEILSCDGDGPIEIQFTNTSTYADEELITFEWTFSNTDENITEENPLFILDEAADLAIGLTVTAADGCSDTYFIEDRFIVIDFVVEELEAVICDSEPVQLNPAADTDLTYVWSPATGLNNPNLASPTANPAETTLYTVTITNPNAGNCAVTQAVNVLVPVYDVAVSFDAEYITCGETAEIQFTDLTTATGTDIIAWEWNFGNGMTSSEQNPSLILTESTMLNASLVVTTENGCEVELLSPQSLPIDLIIIDDETFDEEINVCMGEDIFLNENPDPNYTYEWTPATNLDDPTSPNPQLINANTSTTYTVTISNISIDTCSVERTVFVNVFDTPSPSINAFGQENICTTEGELSVVLGAGESVVWSSDENFNDIISTEPSIITTPGTGTFYYAMVSNQFGCGSEVVSFFSTSSELDLSPEIAQQNLCINGSTELNAILNNTNVPAEWSWSPAAEIDEFLTESSVLVSPTASTTYTLTGTNEFGCSDELSFEVDVIDLENDITAQITTTALITGQPVTLSVTENPDYTYSWSPAAPLDDPTSANPTFTLTGEQTFEVEVTDLNGCSAVFAVVVVPADTPCAEPFVFVPNAFSPNGDGLNEQLRVDGNQITEMNLVIYNRWGEKVFEATDQSQTWDGTYEGRALDPDVFGYIFRATCTNGDTFSAQGNISLLQ